MAINNFINLDKEDALIELKASLLQETIKALIIALYNTLDNKESDNKVKPQVIKLNKALDILERLKLYKGQQEEGNKTLITALIKAERVIKAVELRE